MNDNARSSRKLTFAALAATALAAATLTGCPSEKPEPSKDKPAQTQAPAAQTAPAQAQTQALGAQSPAANVPASAPAATGPNGRSAIPTLDEWNAAKEIGVKGSSKLNCETKMVREWLRVSCRGKNDTGGEPVSVKITKGGGRGDTFTLNGKVTSLVMPYVDGVDLLATFEWTDKKMELHVSWPHGAPMPPLKGEFR